MIFLKKKNRLTITVLTVGRFHLNGVMHLKKNPWRKINGIRLKSTVEIKWKLNQIQMKW